MCECNTGCDTSISKIGIGVVKGLECAAPHWVARIVFSRKGEPSVFFGWPFQLKIGEDVVKVILKKAIQSYM